MSSSPPPPPYRTRSRAAVAAHNNDRHRRHRRDGTGGGDDTGTDNNEGETPPTTTTTTGRNYDAAANTAGRTTSASLQTPTAATAGTATTTPAAASRGFTLMHQQQQQQQQHPYPPITSAAAASSSRRSGRGGIETAMMTTPSPGGGGRLLASSSPSLFSTAASNMSIMSHLSYSSGSSKAASAGATAGTSYMMGQGLVQARISPKSSPTNDGHGVNGGGNDIATAAAVAPSSATTTTRLTTTRGKSSSKNETAERSSAAAKSTTVTNNGETTVADDADVDGFGNNAPQQPRPHVFKQTIIDGVDVTRLRRMVESSLGLSLVDSNGSSCGSGVPCPSSTTLFFAGILYGKTLDVHDNWLYAMALYQFSHNGGGNGGGTGLSPSSTSSSNNGTHNSKRLLAWLEKPEDGLLTTRGGGSGGGCRSGKKKRYYWDAVLWAVTAYNELGDYNSVVQVWTEHCVGMINSNGVVGVGVGGSSGGGRKNSISENDGPLLAPYLSNPKFWNKLEQYRATSSTVVASSSSSSSSGHNHMMLEDDDFDGWAYLGQCLRHDLGLFGPSMTNTTFSIHPLSRVLCIRANAYKQLGHPQRASLVYLTAFKIDPYAIEAFDGWLDNGGCGTMEEASSSSSASAPALTSSNSIPTAEQLSKTLQQVLGDGDINDESPSDVHQIVVDDWLKTYYWAKLFASGAGVGGNAGLSSASFMRPSMVPQGQPQEAITAASSVPAPAAATPAAAATTTSSAASPNVQDAQEMGRRGDNLSTPVPPNLSQLQHHLQTQMRPLQRTSRNGSDDAADGAFDEHAAATDAHLNQHQDDNAMMSSLDVDGGSGGNAMETPTAATTSGFFKDVSNQQDLFHNANLTPIPQQMSMSIIGETTATKKSASSFGGVQKSNDDSNGTFLRSFAVLTENAALDTLWNKYKLQRSPEVLAMAAQQSYRRNDLRSTLRYCRALAEMDPLSLSTSPAAPTSSPSGIATAVAFSSTSDAIYKAGFIHVCTLVALNHKRALFRLAHEWVDASPKSSRAWFAVGAYYYACKQYHVAQRHFCRATRLDPHCPEAWIAFGASFSACDESDQALASFRAAQRLAPGHHVSLLYMGMEYLRTNHIVLAQHFLTAAYRASNASDPLCLSELGVMCCQKSNFKFASSWFLGALAIGNQVTLSNVDRAALLSGDGKTKVSQQDLAQLLEQVQDDYWEPTLFNLAQAFRRDRQYDMAIQCLERALALKESSAGYAALGFCLHLKSISMTAEARSLSRTNRGAFRPGNTPFIRNQVLHRAIDVYHQSLAMKPEDPFCSEMLQKALTDALDQTDFFLQGDVEEKDSNDLATLPMPPRHRDQHGNVQGGRRSMDSTSSSFMSMIGSPSGSEPKRRIVRARFSLGDQSAVTTGGASMASSHFTDGGLSLSVDESADDGDVDMS